MSSKGVAILGFVVTVLQVLVAATVASVRGVDAGSRAATEALSVHTRESALVHATIAARMSAESSTRVIQDTLLVVRVDKLHADIEAANRKLDALLEFQCGGQPLCRQATGRRRP